MSADVTVSVPARPDFVRLLRAVVASVGARFDLTYDRIDDLRMVVDEASAQLLSVPAETLTMTVRPGDRMVIVVRTDGKVNGAWPAPRAEETLAWRVLTGLADEVSFEQSDGGPAVRIEMDVSR